MGAPVLRAADDRNALLDRLRRALVQAGRKSPCVRPPHHKNTPHLRSAVGQLVNESSAMPVMSFSGHQRQYDMRLRKHEVS